MIKGDRKYFYIDTKKIFIINAVLLNFLLVKKTWKNISFHKMETPLHIRVISEDHVTLKTDADHSVLITEINHILPFITVENGTLNCNNISQ